jgi:hypothetical protein
MTYAEQVEQAHKKQQLLDIERASAVGMNAFEYRAWKKRVTAEWVEVIRALMDANNSRDPAEILPEILTRFEEKIGAIAEAKAEEKARNIVQRMLRRAVTPL